MCAMALDTAQAGWERCKDSQTSVGKAPSQQIDWAIKNCRVETPKVLIKNQMVCLWCVLVPCVRTLNSTDQVLRVGPVLLTAFVWLELATRAVLSPRRRGQSRPNIHPLTIAHTDAQRPQLRVYLTWGLKTYEYAKGGRRRGTDNKDAALRPVFDPKFDFYNPQTQTDMLTLCEQIANDRELSQNHVCSFLGSCGRECAVCACQQYITLDFPLRRGKAWLRASS